MEKVIYSKNGGLGIMMSSDENKLDFIEEKSTKILGSVIVPGTKTTLSNYFLNPVEFVGFVRGEKDCMCFYLGENQPDLFGTSIKYFKCIYRISQSRIVDKFKEGTARDFQWINGKWK